MLKPVSKLLYAHQVDMGGIPIRQPLPSAQVEMIDPFLLIHHHASEVKPNTAPLHAGVGPHPHRGFSPVTFIYEGDVNHRDSRGNNEIVSKGGVQWMNAGMGIIHSERPSPELAKNGGKQEIIQLWINTPAAHKMDQPAYFSLNHSDIPKLNSRGVEIDIVAGEYKGVKGFDQTFSKMLILNIRMEKDAEVEIEVPETFNTCLYNFDANIFDDGFGIIEPKYLVLYKNEGNKIRIKASDKTRILFLSGEPLNEPVVSYGPFVLNNETQIMQAMRDYQMGKMGMLIEE
jgi:redox-sensitive bicupin YhaK (pirin superfamily)